MKVLKDWEALVSELQKRISAGDYSYRPLLERAEVDLKAAQDKENADGKSTNGR